ncbi:MAG TPA: LysR substrate-binding domain-containing protein [Candidatus Saccharimonadia bacterium]|nr:LysR substrate-binding domain-containing protein [Candidatus Saccharimonadia bacterium]
MLARSSQLAALAAFEAAARHQNFAHAAAELSLTASAVSHHVRKLEAQLRCSLFQRHARGVLLTAEGRMLADASASALGDLDAVLGSLRAARDLQRIRITMLPSLATCWLMPRLARFAAAHPTVRVSIDADRALSRFEAGGADLGIRYGPGQWAGLDARFLMDDVMFPAASPSLPGVGAVTDADDIAAMPLIGDLSMQGWREWLRAAGARRMRLPAVHHIANTSDAMIAAAAGLGVVLARGRLAQPLLERGELVALPGPELATHFAYYVVYPAHRALAPAATRFVEWLVSEAANAPRGQRGSAPHARPARRPL